MKTVSTTSHLVTFKGKMIRFMFSFILLSLIIHLLAVKANAVDVTLQWDTNADAEYYVVYYGTTSGNYTQNSANITAPAVEHTVTGLDETTWYFSVKAFNGCGNSSDFSDEIVYTSVYSPLSISIESPVLYANITQGQSVNFQSLISGGAAPLAYSWNFGTGGPSGSSVADPGNITFANPGMYTVTLTVTDANNEVQTATVIVTVEQVYVDVTPTAQISSPAVAVTITEGDSVQFEGLVTNGNAAFTYYWNFGAAGISDSYVEDPGSVVFASAGTYNVTFTVTDNDGDISTDTITVNVDERIINVEPVAAISSPASAVNITQGGSVLFNGTVSSGNAPLTHSWDFGTSGLPSNSNEDPGSMVFSNAGTYSVTYTVTDTDGDVSHATTTVTVVVPDTNPTAVITSPSSNVTITQGGSVNFAATVTSGNAPYTHSWNFGTSGVSARTVEDPGTLAFSNVGTFTVTYAVTDSDGDVSSATRSVTVVAPDTNPTAAITSPASSTTITQGGSVNFAATVTSGNAPYTHAWNFGTSGVASQTVEDPGNVTFTSPGLYTVTYTVTDSDGDVSSATRTVTVLVPDTNPTAAMTSPSANVTITQGGSVNFAATVTSGNAPYTHAWNFGTSGVASKTVEDPGSLTFSTVGTFTVTYTVTDNDGDVSSATRTVTVVEPDTNPTAAMTSPSANVTITQGGTVNFAATVTSGNAPYTHAWNFGTSGVANKTVEDPGSLTFSTIGTFIVTYTVTDSDGDTNSATRTVTVSAADTNPTAAISSPSANVSIVQGGSVSFAATVTGGNAPYIHAWNFGTSGIASQTVEDPGSLTFSTMGTFTVTYTVTDNDGDTISATRTVTVGAADTNPTAAISSPSANASIVQGGSVSFAATVTGGNAPYTHAWSFGTSGVASKTVEDPGSLVFSTVGTFTVTYTVTDSDGDTNSATRTVTVAASNADLFPHATITSPASNLTIAQGGSVNFQGTVESGNAPYRYRWSFGWGGPSKKSVEDPGSVTFPTSGSYLVSFIVMDNDRDVSTDTMVVTVSSKAAAMDKASLITPANGAKVSLTPRLVADAGEIDGDTQWQISTNAAFTDVVLDVTQKIGSDVLDVTSQVLDGSTTYYWRMKHNSIKSNISNWSDVRSFTTAAPAWNDQNGNGVPDAQETEDDIDLNNDGEVDHNQDILKTVRSYNGKASFGLVKIENVLDIEILEAMNDEAIEDTTGKPGRMPSGLIGFRIITENPGDTVLVGICLPEAAPANAGWFKYDTILGWQDYSSIATFSADRKNIVIELSDGGDGDADGCINGVIVDPAGLGIADSESLDSSNVVVGAAAGGAGCFISSVENTLDERTIAALGILLIFAIGAVIRRKESQK